MTRFVDVLGSEVLRLRSRRSLLAILGLLPMIAIGITLLQGLVAHDDYDQARAAFREDRAARYEDERSNFLHMRSTMGDQLPPAARDLTKDEFLSGKNFFGGREKIVSRRYDARVHVPETASLVAAATTLIAFTLGAVSVGRDWLVGTMAGLLLWQPRRVQTLLARLVVLGSAVLIVAVGSLLLVWIGGLLDGSLRGTAGGLDSAWWADQAWFAVRACGVGIVCAVVGAISADILRSATASLGAMVAAMVLNPVIGSLLPSARPWLPVSLIETVFDWGKRFRTFDGPRLVDAVWVPGGTALAVLVMTTVGLGVAAAAARGRRDAV